MFCFFFSNLFLTHLTATYDNNKYRALQQSGAHGTSIISIMFHEATQTKTFSS